MWIKSSHLPLFPQPPYKIVDYAKDFPNLLMADDSGKLTPHLLLDLLGNFKTPLYLIFDKVRGGDNLFIEGAYHHRHCDTYGLVDKIAQALTVLFYSLDVLPVHRLGNYAITGTLEIESYLAVLDGLTGVENAPVIIDINNNVFILNDTSVEIERMITSSYLHLRDGI